jgi:hypothetical protein
VSLAADEEHVKMCAPPRFVPGITPVSKFSG